VRIVHSNLELAQAVAEARAAGKRIGFVPTMGALHAGHLSLVRLAQEHADFVVVSIFVNPLQFGAGEDFDKYPRTLETDAAALETLNADLVYAPSANEIYADESGVLDQSVKHHAGPVGAGFEGAIRPGHFDGMLTVVARLFDLVKPDVAVFGAKDAQQLFLVRQLAAEHYPALRIVAAPIVREASGLAMSSRNRYLSAADLEVAQSLSASLRAADAASRASGGTAASILAAASQVMAANPSAKLDYLALVDQRTFAPVADGFVGPALMLIAARVGTTRLLDNQEILVGQH
jgi:pantoate--beta-alanine ligase